MENFSLVKVKWSEHRERLKPFIDKIAEKAHDPELYTGIDKACSNEWAFLFLASDGFIVLQPRYQREIIYLDVTVAHCTSGNAIPKYLPFIIKLAKKGLDYKPHRERFLKEKIDEKFKDPQDNLRIVFVCAMWLTGFDAPTVSTLYLDKPLKSHTLMQTIARANRVYAGKSAGQIVDYINIFS